jgi:hypothetical protein
MKMPLGKTKHLPVDSWMLGLPKSVKQEPEYVLSPLKRRSNMDVLRGDVKKKLITKKVGKTGLLKKKKPTIFNPDLSAGFVYNMTDERTLGNPVGMALPDVDYRVNLLHNTSVKIGFGDMFVSHDYDLDAVFTSGTGNDYLIFKYNQAMDEFEVISLVHQ